MNREMRLRTAWVFCVALVALATGCERRQFYRQQADEDVNCIIQQNTNDPRYALAGVNVRMDPRSRYYDPYNQDYTPMPEDDPESHKFMHCVDGMRGYPFWHIDGTRTALENPQWREMIGEYAPLTEDGEILLDADAALRIAYVNSLDYQDQLETLYLSALDVSTERFRLDTQFFGGTDTVYSYLGENAGGESAILRQNTDLSASRQFATAGTLLVSFANSFVWQFSGSNTNSAFSLLGFTFAQPLLRNGGRVIALERLTIAERALLSNLRAFERYRHGFYTDIVVGNSGVSGLQRRGGFFGGTGLSGFTGTGAGGIGGVGSGTFGFGGGGVGGGAGGAAGTGLAGGGAGSVGGFLGLLQTLQEFRNAQDSFDLQVRTLSVLEAYLNAGQIDLVQVDRFRQSIETQRAQLLQSEIGLENSVEAYLTGTLSLPPDLPVKLDDSFIRRFQLVADEFTRLQTQFFDVQDSLAIYAEPDPDRPETLLTIDRLREVLDLVEVRRASVEEYLLTIREELVHLREVAGQREAVMTPAEQRTFAAELERLGSELEDLLARAEANEPRLANIGNSLNPDSPIDGLDLLIEWMRDFQFLMQEIALLQARIRVESVTLQTVQLDSDDALTIALANRFDVMNNRASVVDTWRLIAFNANSLQSDVTVRLDGDMGTAGKNPLDLSGATGTMSARLEFDAPFTRLLERNNYRQSLIDYQGARRQYIVFVDGVNRNMRAVMRQLEQLRLNLEIQRRAVVIAIRRVDATQQELNKPLDVPEPGGAPPTRGATTAQELLSALEDLRNTQNNFMSVWLNYYATRMSLIRDLGLMELDEEGRWIDRDYDFAQLLLEAQACDAGLPPALPEEWIEEAFPEELPGELQPIQEIDRLEQELPVPLMEPELNEAMPISYEQASQRTSPEAELRRAAEAVETRGEPQRRRRMAGGKRPITAATPAAGIGSPNWGATQPAEQELSNKSQVQSQSDRQVAKKGGLPRLPFKLFASRKQESASDSSTRR